MDMLEFATNAVQAANQGLVTLLPITKRDQQRGCVIRFVLTPPVS